MFFCEDQFSNTENNSLIIWYLDVSIKAVYPWEVKLQFCHRSWFSPGLSPDEGYVMSLRVGSKTLASPSLLALMPMMSLYKTEAGFGPCCCAYSLHGDTCRNLPLCLKKKKTWILRGVAVVWLTAVLWYLSRLHTHTYIHKIFIPSVFSGRKRRTREAPVGFMMCHLF